MVLIERKKNDKQGIKMKTTDLGYKRKKYDNLRKVFKLKANTLVELNHGTKYRENKICLQSEIDGTFPTDLHL